MMSKNIYITLAFLAFLFFKINAQEKPLTFGALYVGDFVNNLSGGIKTGSAYLGMANLTIEFNTENAKLWHGGTFFIRGANTHGATPTADLAGDMQGFSNIEAGNHTYLQEIWYKQKVGSFEFTAGLQDLAMEFAHTEYGALFLNSSFGVKPSIAHNVPAPIFPLTNLGFTAHWKVSGKFTWLAAIYDGTPKDFDDRNPYNLCWKLSKNDGYLAVSELQFRTGKGTYKAGILQSHYNEGDETQNIVGFYLNGNRSLWEREERNLGVFAQLGYSPSDIGSCKFDTAAGIYYKGLFSSKGNDEMGIAFSHEHYNKNLDLEPETAIELTYKYHLLEEIFIQPNIQYIINPAGTGVNLDNALLANLRLGIEF